jgi:DNA-binding XRE family transcriptional regulator
MSNEVGLRLKELRRKLNMTQAQLGTEGDRQSFKALHRQSFTYEKKFLYV